MQFEPTYLLAFVAGLMVPFEYAMGRLRGFGRHLLSKLPYHPPETPDSEEVND
ncbi:hypothetical protein [Haloarchaeobius sp. DT45]|uniref:hypothetical protein n=1 Tax=Haloarchaeobius sp. DT45 TaxID=3446116 RepID=UPI003F6D587A